MGKNLQVRINYLLAYKTLYITGSERRIEYGNKKFIDVAYENYTSIWDINQVITQN